MSKRLESCPGVTSASASGKIMRPLPVMWGGQQKLEPQEVADIKPKLEDLTLENPEDDMPELELDATFCADFKDGKRILYLLFQSKCQSKLSKCQK